MSCDDQKSCDDCVCRAYPAYAAGTYTPPVTSSAQADALNALTLRLNALEVKHYKLRLEVCYIWTVLSVAALVLITAIFIGF